VYNIFILLGYCIMDCSEDLITSKKEILDIIQLSWGSVVVEDVYQRWNQGLQCNCIVAASYYGRVTRFTASDCIETASDSIFYSRLHELSRRCSEMQLTNIQHFIRCPMQLKNIYLMQSDVVRCCLDEVRCSPMQ